MIEGYDIPPDDDELERISRREDAKEEASIDRAQRRKENPELSDYKFTIQRHFPQPENPHWVIFEIRTTTDIILGGDFHKELYELVIKHCHGKQNR